MRYLVGKLSAIYRASDPLQPLRACCILPSITHFLISDALIIPSVSSACDMQYFPLYSSMLNSLLLGSRVGIAPNNALAFAGKSYLCVANYKSRFMDKLEITSFLKSSGAFAPLSSHPLFLACLDEALERSYCVNGVEVDRSEGEILRDAAGTCRALISNTWSNIQLSYRGVLVNSFLTDRERLLSLLDQLTDEL